MAWRREHAAQIDEAEKLAEAPFSTEGSQLGLDELPGDVGGSHQTVYRIGRRRNAGQNACVNDAGPRRLRYKRLD